MWVEKIGDLSPKKHDEPHKKSILFFTGGNQSQDPKATQIRDCVSVLTNHKMVLDIHLPTGMKVSNWNFISQHCRTQSQGWFIIRLLEPITLAPGDEGLQAPSMSPQGFN